MSTRETEKVAERIFSLYRIEPHLLRSDPPHMGGGFTTRRLFGGQQVAQCYAAVKSVLRGLREVPASIFYRFEIAGTISDANEFLIDWSRFKNRLIGVQVKQAGKTIGRAVVRLAESRELLDGTALDEMSFATIPSPDLCPRILEARMKPPYDRIDLARHSIFEFRIVVQPTSSARLDCERSLVWARLRPDVLRSFSGPPFSTFDRTCAALLLSDFYIVDLSAALHRRLDDQIFVKTAASLTHDVWIHDGGEDDFSNSFDGWMLYDCQLYVASRNRTRLEAHVLVRDSVTRRMRCLVTCRQETFCVSSRL